MADTMGHSIVNSDEGGLTVHNCTEIPSARAHGRKWIPGSGLIPSLFGSGDGR
jgi:hypothetical protein